MSHRVFDYDNMLSSEVSLADAVTFAEARLIDNKGLDGQGYTYTIGNEPGKLVASVTNRRIIGGFTKQHWGGRKGNDAIHVGDESFDATDYVLCMPYEDLLEVRDNRQSSDNIGIAHIQWDGPYEVDIVESICEFFGVARLKDITPEMFEFSQKRVQPCPPQTREVELTLKLKVVVNPGASLADFIRDAQCTVQSSTGGVTVSSVKMTSTCIEENRDA